MKKRFTDVLGFLSIIVFFAAVLGPIRIAAAQEKRPPPQFNQIEQAVWDYFKSQPGFQASMLITREQVEPLFSKLAQMGFEVPNSKSILDKLPSGNEFFVAALYSPAGLKFMEQFGRYAELYDRLDRLSRMPRGRQTVQDVIKDPGGQQMMRYLTAAPSGKSSDKSPSNVPRAADFNKPTGRIYTVPMLLRQLQGQYNIVARGK